MSRAQRLLQSIPEAAPQIVAEDMGFSEDNEYQLAVLLLQRFAVERSYKKVSAQLKKQHGAGITADEGLTELSAYFTEENHHSLAYIADAIRDKREEWRILSLIELDAYHRKIGSGSMALAALRVALAGSEQSQKLYKSTPSSGYPTDKLLDAIIAKMPADFQTELRNDYGIQFGGK